MNPRVGEVDIPYQPWSHASARHRIPSRVGSTRKETGGRDKLPSGSNARGREWMTASILKHAADLSRLTAISTKPRHTQLTPSSAIEHVENAGTQRHHTTAQDTSSRS